ncbi:MAG: hypothetical protein M1828_005053 [Chrysothrix sp. TS-e1954]|nr:MAG: hypothetical protein M1828_005053 [Chrysothrix sp. TS-e1954]
MASFTSSPPHQLTLNTASILAKFDKLVSDGELFYEYTRPEVLSNSGISLALRSVPSFKHKPLDPTSGPAQSKTHQKPNDGSDIDHADPAYFVAYVHGDPSHSSATHKLIFNKFCVVRPQYLLLAVDPAHKQTEPLNQADWSAACQVLGALGEEPRAAGRIGLEAKESEVEREKAVLGSQRQYFGLYNCSPTAGSSRMHKHVQIFPLPVREHDGMELMENLPTSRGEGRGLPIVIHEEALEATGGLRSADLPGHLHEVARGHVAACKRDLKLGEGEDVVVPLNHVLTQQMMLTIPRRNPTVEGLADHVINAAGMLGHAWAGNVEQEEAWREVCSGRGEVDLGMVYRGLGVPVDGSDG